MSQVPRPDAAASSPDWSSSLAWFGPASRTSPATPGANTADPTSGTPREHVLAALCRAALRTVEAERVAVRQVLEDGRSEVVHVEPPWAWAALCEQPPVDEPVPDAVAAPEPHHVPPWQRGSQPPVGPTDHRDVAPRSADVASLPLVAGHWSWGTLDLYRTADREWTESELAVAGLLAQAAGSVLTLADERDAWERGWRAAQHTATHDHLTGLPNRGLLFDRLEHAIANGARNGRAVAVLFIDIDDFKGINDRFGHAAGDATLVEVARRLARTTRANDTLARLSGDEFVIVCEDLGSTAASVHHWLGVLAERIHHDLRRAPLPGETDIRVSVSIGAAITTRVCSPQVLTGKADDAMYVAKRSGGGRLVVSRNRPGSHAT